MTIGTLADHFGLATHVLRHWETMGLLAPFRDAAGRRTYQRDDLLRVAAILRAKEAGFGLDDIRALLTAEGPGRRHEALAARRDALRRTIAAAEAQLDLVECALGCGHDDLATCPHFHQFLAERAGLGDVRPVLPFPMLPVPKCKTP